MAAIRLVELFGYLPKKPAVGASADGAIVFEWDVNKMNMTVDVYSDEMVEVLIFGGDSDVDVTLPLPQAADIISQSLFPGLRQADASHWELRNLA